MTSPTCLEATRGMGANPSVQAHDFHMCGSAQGVRSLVVRLVPVRPTCQEVDYVRLFAEAVRLARVGVELDLAADVGERAVEHAPVREGDAVVGLAVDDEGRRHDLA